MWTTRTIVFATAACLAVATGSKVPISLLSGSDHEDKTTKHSCSGHGVWTGDACTCEDTFLGDMCQFKMGANGYGKYVGEDAPSSPDSSSSTACMHGHYGCPSGSEFCSKASCICEQGWKGDNCDVAREKCVVKDCAHDVALDPETCECDCKKPWGGELCKTCDVECPGLLEADPNDDCRCSCPKDLCGHHGVANRLTCQCACAGAWKGDRCDQCETRRCLNNGIFNTHTCMCDCMPPWLPKDDCATCPMLQCMNGGTMNFDTCQCECQGLWTGATCDECPSFESLVVAGMDCGDGGFNTETCTCRNACGPKLRCQHGSQPSGSGDDCTCSCDTIPTQVKKGEDAVENGTFWSGEACDECSGHAREACEKKDLRLNEEICACTSSKDGDGVCSIQEKDCQNDSTFNPDKCRCDCPDGFVGLTCASSESDAAKIGTSKDMAATSCRQIRRKNPEASSGTYWIQGPKATSPMKMLCDMEANGGGWALLANIDLSDLATVPLDKNTYEQGVGNPENTSSFVLPCNEFETGDDKVEIRVTMRFVRDYFRPIPGETLCSMLTSHKKHLWSPSDGSPDSLRSFHEVLCGADEKKCLLTPYEEQSTDMTSLLELLATTKRKRAGDTSRHLRTMRRRLLSEDEPKDATPLGGNEGVEDERKKEMKDVEELSKSRWYQPEYVENEKLSALLGGAKKEWTKEIDGRSFVSFWGGDKGGCCHYTSKLYPGEDDDQKGADEGSWGREFRLHVRPL